MSRHASLYEDGLEAYKASRCREAALLFRAAASAALEVDDRKSWFKYMVWAEAATEEMDDYSAAMSLLIDARTGQPEDADEYEQWICRKRLFGLVLATHPKLERLTQVLHDLSEYAKTHTTPAADIPKLEGELQYARGNWSAALERCEAAWSLHDGEGYLKSTIVSLALDCCLRMRRADSAEDWLSTLSECNTEWAYTSEIEARARLMLGRLTQRPYADLVSLLRTYADRESVSESQTGRHSVRDATVRVELLDQSVGDPASPYHPARASMDRVYGRADVNSYYRRRLLLLDYRLASLRFAGGVSPRDDQFPSAGVMSRAGSIRVSADELTLRIAKARSAGNWAFAKARELDGLLECGWRQLEVVERKQEIERIARESTS